MKSIARLFSAFGTLADSLLALAGVIDVATGRIRMQLAHEDTLPDVIEHQPAAEGKGRKAARN